MKTTIYFFSGTGNSLMAAKKIGALLGETDLVPIASFQDRTGDIMAPAGRVGFICPVYDSGVPVIVRDFIRRIRLDPGTYVFAVVTMGGSGGSALRMINSCLSEKNNKSLNSGFPIRMPGNFPPVSQPPSGKKCESILAAADTKLEQIASIIRDGKDQPVGLYPGSLVLQALLYPGFSKNVHNMDERLSVSDACTSCGICTSVCPLDNIAIREGKPQFHHRCELCCACLNFCPTRAIDLHMLFGTQGRGRYHHPAVSVTDIGSQKVSR
jgi:ferredoxin